MFLTAKEKRDLVIRKSRHGRGIYARRDFFPGEIIFQVVGKRITCDEGDELDDAIRANTFRFDIDTYISPVGRVGDFLNHSCSPNAKISKNTNRLFVIAMDTILKGEEVVIDYSTILASDDTWEMNCNCGSENCRGLIKKFNSLPRKIKKKYLLFEMVPNYCYGKENNKI